MGTVDAERKQIELLYEIRDLLQALVGRSAPVPDPFGLNAYFEDKGGNAILEMLVASSLPSAPDLQVPVNVTPVEVLLAQNETAGLLYVVVSNDSFAQAIWVGPMGVTNATGRRVPPLASIPFVLPPGAYIYAVCNIAVVSARISRGFPINDIVSAAKAMEG